MKEKFVLLKFNKLNLLDEDPIIIYNVVNAILPLNLVPMEPNRSFFLFPSEIPFVANDLEGINSTE